MGAAILICKKKQDKLGQNEVRIAKSENFVSSPSFSWFQYVLEWIIYFALPCLLKLECVNMLVTIFFCFLSAVFYVPL